MIETKAPTTASMTIRYQLTIDDWLALNRFYHKTSPIMQKQFRKVRMIYAFIAMLSAFTTIFSIAKKIDMALIVAVMIVGLILYVGTANVVKTQADKNARKLYESGQNKTLREVTTLTVSPDYIESQSVLLESSIKWPLVEKIAIEEDYIFIFVSADQAIIIPNRAFQSKAQRREFIELINRYHTVKYA